MFSPIWCFLLMMVFCDSGVDANTVTLTPTQVSANENSSATLTCSRINGILLETRWQNSQIPGDANLLLYNGKCMVTRFLLNSDQFEGVCNGDGTYSVVLKRIDRRQHGAEWMCKETAFSLSNKVVIHVLVPATEVTLRQPNGEHMRENQTIRITCNTSECRPDPRVQWYLRDSKTGVDYNLTHVSNYTYVEMEYGLKAVESVLYFKPNRTVNGLRLYCDVRTRPNKSDITSREIFFNVIYPPDNDLKVHGFETINAFQVIESDTGTFICSVTGGNPLATLSWDCFGSDDVTVKRQGNTVASTVRWTALRNYSTCSCLAQHISNWQKIKNITLDVQFPTEISTFSFSTEISGEPVVVNKTSNPSLVCIAQANPSSNLSIINPRGDSITEVSNSNIARHTLVNVSYIDAGEYTCTGRNNYTKGTSARSHLILIVKCPPKPSSGDTSVKKVATVLNVDVTLMFSAMKYLDVPNRTVFKWFRENDHISDNGVKYTIREGDLQTNLSIRNTTKTDLGLYRVFVRNSVGEYLHYYELNAAGKPDPPKDFHIIDNSVTDTTVTLTWSPSFNGGFQQTFVLIYRTNPESVWLKKSIIDNGKEVMHYAIYGLSSMQLYEIEMFAKNREGNSAHTERLQIKTKASIHRLKDTFCPSNTRTFFGVGAGTFFSTFVLVVFLLFGYKQIKKRYFSRSKSHQQGDMKEHQVPVTENSNASSAYTDLDGNKKEVNVYDVVNEQNLGTTSSQHNMTTQSTNAYIEMTDARTKESLDYINIKI